MPILLCAEEFGNFVYFPASTPNRVMIVDVSDRANPQIAGAYSLPGDNLSIDIWGPHMYINGGFAGINVLDGR